MDTNNWKEIPGFKGYDAHPDGIIASRMQLGNKRNTTRPRRVLKTMIAPHGYPTVHLRCEDGKRRKVTVHSLILTTFIGPRPQGAQACHNNGVRSDCRLENLRWDTPKANQQDSIIHGTKLQQRIKVSTISPDEREMVREKFRNGQSAKSLASQYGVTFQTIYKILKEKESE
jgi:hypothetical protein